MTATARRALVVGLPCLAAPVGVTAPASTHAQLEGSDPAAGDVLSEPSGPALDATTAALSTDPSGDTTPTSPGR